MEDVAPLMGKAVGTVETQYEPLNYLLFDITVYGYLAAFLLFAAYVVFRNKRMATAAVWVTWGFFGVETVALGLRGYESHKLGIGHAPITNLYESLVFLAWVVILGFILMERKFKIPALGVLALPFSFALMAYAASAGVQHKIQPLVPALQSYWLLIHVTVIFLAYAAFCCSGFVGIAYLFKARAETVLARAAEPSGTPPVAAMRGGEVDVGGGTGFWSGVDRFLPRAAMLDEIGYKTVMFGFPLMALGIILGAAWANEAWGSYWSWDPKETWALIVWLIYAAYLHARIMRGWRGTRTAWLQIIGFAATIFCYLGVNLFLSGLHSYAS